MPSDPPKRRLAVAAATRRGEVPVVRVGVPRRLGADIYPYLLKAPWPAVLAILGSAYLLANTLFALLYLATGNGIANARPGSFSDAFFFSVQTMATVGYGVMAPKTVPAQLLMTVESVTGLLGFAVATGLMFAKFSRPTARVVFSRRAAIGMRDGKPTLMVRMGNERGNQLVDARASLMFVRDERTGEGELVRRLHPLPLVHAETPLFVVTWTALHVIDAASPLFGASAESLARSDAELVVTLVGVDDIFSTSVYARHSYLADELAFGSRFADVMTRLPDGRFQVDFSHFHDLVPEAAASPIPR
jgi:inward rectifier potassium channel